MKRALVDRLRALPHAKREAILSQLSVRQLATLRWCWEEFWARPDERDHDAVNGTGQLPPPGDFTWWGVVGGKGGGKTRACAEWVNREAMRLPGVRFHLLGATEQMARATMVEDESGILATAPPWAKIEWKPSIGGGQLRWVNGSTARVFSAEGVDVPRGSQCSRMWIDDPAAFGPKGMDTLVQLLDGFRKRAPDGSDIRGVISTTPVDSEILRWILSGEHKGRKFSFRYSRCTSDDNRSNLSPKYFTEHWAELEGTEQEFMNRLGKFDPFATAKVFANIDFSVPPVRVELGPERFRSVAVWVDPALSTSTRSCEVGLVAAGITYDGHVWLLKDASGVMGANEWPDRALELLDGWRGAADEAHLGVEINRGLNQPAEMLRMAEKIRRMRAGQPGVSFNEIREVFAHRSKAQRATPLPRLYRAGQVHHLPGLGELERQLRQLEDNSRAPLDRADAAVYCILDLAGALDEANSIPFGGSANRDDQPTAGPVPMGAVAVGPIMQQSHAQARPQSFQFTRPAGWK